MITVIRAMSSNNLPRQELGPSIAFVKRFFFYHQII